MGDNKPLSVEMTFEELFERWRVTVVPTIKNTTADYYFKMLKAHVMPAFGERGIQAIGRYEVETFLAERAKMSCRNTHRGMRVSLGRVLTWAVDCGWLPKNPCAGVKLPLAGKKVVRNARSVRSRDGTADQRSHRNQMDRLRRQHLAYQPPDLSRRARRDQTLHIGAQLADT
jgi:hypothetical protein